MLAGLQVVRFFAALSVVFGHTLFYGAQSGVIPAAPQWLVRLLGEGPFVFFALSGFLMARLSSQHTEVTRFLAHRLLRIYPAFLVAVAATLVAKFVLSRVWVSYGGACNILLIPCGNNGSVLFIEWTLVYEMSFYALIAVCCLLSERLRRGAILIWASVIVIVNFIARDRFTTPFPTIGQVYLSRFDLVFIAGMAAFWMRRYAEERELPLLTFGLLVLIVMPWAPDALVAAAIGSCCVVLAASTPRVSKMFSRRSLAVLGGDGSYGLYLMHVPVMSILFTASPVKGFAVSSGKGWLVAAMVSLVAIAAGSTFGLAEFGVYKAMIGVMSKRRDQLYLQSPASSSSAAGRPAEAERQRSTGQ